MGEKLQLKFKQCYATNAQDAYSSELSTLEDVLASQQSYSDMLPQLTSHLKIYYICTRIPYSVLNLYDIPLSCTKSVHDVRIVYQSLVMCLNI